MLERGVEIKPRALSQFVGLVEHGDAGRAADALATTPRALMRAVRELERDAGEALLAHDERQVTLTPAGAAMVQSARRVLAAIDRLADVARADRSTLRVAHVAGSDTASAILDHAVALGRGLRAEERVVADDRQLEELGEHRIDVAICTVAGAMPAGIDALLLRLDPLMVATRGPSAASSPGLVAPVYGSVWSAHDALVDAWSQATGVVVRRVPVPVGSGREIAALLRAAGGDGVLAAASTAGGSGATLAPPPGRQPYLGWTLAWRRDDTSAEVAALIAGARQLAERRGWLEPLPGGGAPLLIDAERQVSCAR